MSGLPRRTGRWAGVALAVLGLAAGTAAAMTGLHLAADRAAAWRVARDTALTVAAGDRPSGFWNGTDSRGVPVPGSGPYREPTIGGAYGGYIGMAGNWANWQRCKGDKVVWSATDSARANTDHSTYHKGIGTGVYWFMGGPGVDPHYNGTLREAYAWGAAQAKRTLYDIRHRHLHVTYPVVFMDVELPGYAPGYTPAEDNGWNDVYTSACSGKIKAVGIAAAVDRADFDGYAAYLTTHSSYKAGVYSAPSIWADIFGDTAQASIPNTYEWTYTGDTASLSRHPDGWCLRGSSTCAQFFGGITSGSRYALMWQWSGGGGTYNGVGDFDQIDGHRTP
jgi:hypothetical protein